MKEERPGRNAGPFDFLKNVLKTEPEDKECLKNRNKFCFFEVFCGYGAFNCNAGSREVLFLKKEKAFLK